MRKKYLVRVYDLNRKSFYYLKLWLLSSDPEGNLRDYLSRPHNKLSHLKNPKFELFPYISSTDSYEGLNVPIEKIHEYPTIYKMEGYREQPTVHFWETHSYKEKELERRKSLERRESEVRFYQGQRLERGAFKVLDLIPY